MVAHSVLWASPQPLWGRFGTVEAAAFRADDQARPALLRFTSDEFMQQVIAMLEADPRRIGDTLARPETWRNPSGETPELPEPVRLPRFARSLARLRAGAAVNSALAPTTSEQALPPLNGTRPPMPLKLYHPAHQRHYLVTANLVCGVPGFPDREVATGGREQVGFVLRRLLTVGTGESAVEHEYAWVRDARGPHWERIPRDDGSADHYAQSVLGEEMLPLFNLNFRDDVGHPRRLLAGTVPVGRREEYMSGRRYEAALPANGGAVTVSVPDVAAEAKTKKSARKEQLKFDVTEPWKAIIRAMHKAAERSKRAPDEGTDGEKLQARMDTACQANEGAQLQSWLILLDFADYLALHLPDVWAAVTGSNPSPALPGPQLALFNWLNGDTTSRTGTPAEWQLTGGTFATSMRDALSRIATATVRAALEQGERTFVVKHMGTSAWPPFYYLLAGVRYDGLTSKFTPDGLQSSLASLAGNTPDPDDVEANPKLTVVPSLPKFGRAEEDAAKVDKLVQLVMAAVDADATTPAPPIPFGVQVRDAMVSTRGDAGWFVIRCAYVRCDCGPLRPTVLSAPSQKFQLASFFDSDAPARPIRIALPIDTTAAGMRKHQKNTAFVISDVLCGQVNRLKGLGFVDLVLSVLPWPFHKDLDIGQDGIGPCSDSENFGMICTLSIPIITICALILLFMIVLVFDLIFHWIPWFIVCFPLRAFKAKRPT